MTRKYRQKGYQDEERGREGSGSASGPRPPGPPPDRLRPERPRGRGLGAPTRKVFRCAVCGGQQPAPEAAAVAATCEGCSADLHTCTHCLHFDTSTRFECRQPVPERVARKSQANECTLFAPRVSMEHEPEKAEPGDARAAFDDLFKNL